jgi:hypothetical protein
MLPLTADEQRTIRYCLGKCRITNVYNYSNERVIIIDKGIWNIVWSSTSTDSVWTVRMTREFTFDKGQSSTPTAAMTKIEGIVKDEMQKAKTILANGRTALADLKKMRIRDPKEFKRG